MDDDTEKGNYEGERGGGEEREKEGEGDRQVGRPEGEDWYRRQSEGARWAVVDAESPFC